MIVKIINTSQCTECDFNDLHYVIGARSDGNQLAFRFEEDSVPDFFKDKTSYTYEQFEAMTKDPSDAWYIA
jgi:hypothetical protein|tara:strand:+ start:1055 stop:1267 length:213 start_codon:yes stop_codon:yes gene_type:complete